MLAFLPSLPGLRDNMMLSISSHLLTPHITFHFHGLVQPALEEKVLMTYRIMTPVSETHWQDLIRFAKTNMYS